MTLRPSPSSLRLIIVSLIVLTLQWIWPVSWEGVKPDLLLAWTIVVGLRYRMRWGIIIGIWFGVLAECVSAGTDGALVITLPLAGAMAGWIRKRLILDHPWPYVLISLILITLWQGLVYAWLTQGFSPIAVLDWSRFGISVGLTTVCSLFLRYAA